MHDAGRRMASRAQKQVADFVCRKMPQNDSVPHTMAGGELAGVIREYVGDDGETAVFRNHGEAETVPSLTQTVRHGSRQYPQRQSGGSGRDLASRKTAGIFGR